MFLTAVAMVRDGRIGKVKQRDLRHRDHTRRGKTFHTSEFPPSQLNWDLWLGQRSRWTISPSGATTRSAGGTSTPAGKITDWSAHHVDIAQWAIGMEDSGPKSVEMLGAEHPVPFKNGMPTVDNRFNTATAFQVRCNFPNDVELLIRHDTENGILFEGEKGTIFVSRSKLVGDPVDELANNPIPESALIAPAKASDSTATWATSSSVPATEPRRSRTSPRIIACSPPATLPTSPSGWDERSTGTRSPNRLSGILLPTPGSAASHARDLKSTREWLLATIFSLLSPLGPQAPRPHFDSIRFNENQMNGRSGTPAVPGGR